MTYVYVSRQRYAKTDLFLLSQQLSHKEVTQQVIYLELLGQVDLQKLLIFRPSKHLSGVDLFCIHDKKASIDFGSRQNKCFKNKLQ